ncbi:MAG: hypothetical protein JRD89_01475 [Deltaproteobacteria bacterium]|nr:hypothetical protein [Deltaproteobacteria bacterium]
MSLDLETYHDAFEAWILSATGLPSQFKNAAQVFQAKARVKLNLTVVAGLGIDENREDYDDTQPAGSELVPNIAGPRLLTLGIVVESRDQRPNTSAQYYIEKIRTSIKKPKIKAALHAAGLGFSSFEGYNELDPTIMHRVESRVAIDAIFNAAANDIDTSEARGYVDTLEISYDLEKPVGTISGTDTIDGSGL